MSGHANADPAFLNNVATAASTTTASSTTSSSTSSKSSYTLTSTTSHSNASFSTVSSAVATTTANAASSSATDSPSPDRSLLQSVYFYDPLTAGAVAFASLYFLHIIYHFYLSIYIPHIRKSVPNKHNYTISLLVAAVFSTLGFSIRIASVSSESGRASFGLYASSTCSVIIAPIFVCATLYLMVTHLIRLCLPSGPEQTFLGMSPRWLGRVFITSDVLSFLLQGAGSAIVASGNWEEKSRDVGENVLIVGLAAQLATFTVYMVVLLLFCLRVSTGKSEKKGEGDFRRRESLVKGDGNGVGREFGFNPLVTQVVRGMWIASILVETRTIYRTIEFGMGVEGYLFRHEWPLWMFEAVPIWVALLVLGVYHPTKWLQQKRRSAFLHDKQVVRNSRE